MFVFSRKKTLTPHNEVILRNEVVERTKKDKFLDWKDHITMMSEKKSKFCGIIYRIRNNFSIKYKKLIYYSPIHPYLTCCINIVWSSTYQTNLESFSTVQKISVSSLVATAQQPHSRTIFTAQKNFPLSKLI